MADDSNGRVTMAVIGAQIDSLTRTVENNHSLQTAELNRFRADMTSVIAPMRDDTEKNRERIRQLEQANAVQGERIQNQIVNNRNLLVIITTIISALIAAIGKFFGG